MKKIIALLLVTAMAFSFAGCSNSANNSTPTNPADSNVSSADTGSASNANQAEDTLGTQLVTMFEEEINKIDDLEAVCRGLADATGQSCDVFSVEEGFLNGFSEEIKGFKKGYGFAPFIGSIPLVGYVFETEDTAALEQTLTSLADPRWNICTEAAETVVKSEGNYVFFAMCPSPDELG